MISVGENGKQKRNAEVRRWISILPRAPDNQKFNVPPDSERFPRLDYLRFQRLQTSFAPSKKLAALTCYLEEGV